MHETSVRKGGGDEGLVGPERPQDHLLQVTRARIVLRHLQVLLDPRRLGAGGDAPVHPGGAGEEVAGAGHLPGREDVGDHGQHGATLARRDRP